MKPHTVTPKRTPSQYVDGAAYAKAYRKYAPDKARRNAQITNARHSAALWVAKRHPEEFERAIHRERKKRGL